MLDGQQQTKAAAARGGFPRNVAVYFVGAADPAIVNVTCCGWLTGR
jgi:hypothetical protein